MTEQPCILGIDPGISGAIAFWWPNASALTVEDMPVTAGMVCAPRLTRRLAQMAPDLAIIEDVHAMRGQGVSSMFRFGQAYGIAIGVVLALGIPTRFVTPQTWKRHWKLPADKEAARERIIQMVPHRAELFERKKDHGRAEAALIAMYGEMLLPKREVAL